MADLIFNTSKGIFRYYAGLPAANDALVIVALEATGLVSDATMKDYDNLGAILSGASNEQTTVGRISLTSSATITVDDTNDRVDVDIPDQTYPGATGNDIGALVICYDPDTTGGTDADLIPISKHDFVVSPNGGDIVAQVAATGFSRAS